MSRQESGYGGTADGQGAITHTIRRSVSRRGGLCGILVRTALAGRLRLPRVCGLWAYLGTSLATGTLKTNGFPVRMGRFRSKTCRHTTAGGIACLGPRHEVSVGEWHRLLARAASCQKVEGVDSLLAQSDGSGAGQAES